MNRDPTTGINTKFIVDVNVGKLAKLLRMMGYDASSFQSDDDAELISQALLEGRILLTRDTRLMKWGVIRDGHIQAVLLQSDDPHRQIRQVIRDLNMDVAPAPFTICLECNRPLTTVDKSGLQDRLPPYVFSTRNEFKQCPVCRRVYWRGTHWTAMVKKLEDLRQS
jgi:uncharacterized protein